MDDVDRQCFTVGVFQDAEWAERGLEALKKEGLPSESLSLISRETPETAALVQRVFGLEGDRLDIVKIGPVVAPGPLVGALQGQARDDTGMLEATDQQLDRRTFEDIVERVSIARGLAKKRILDPVRHHEARQVSVEPNFVERGSGARSVHRRVPAAQHIERGPQVWGRVRREFR